MLAAIQKAVFYPIFLYFEAFYQRLLDRLYKINQDYHITEQLKKLKQYKD